MKFWGQAKAIEGLNGNQKQDRSMLDQTALADYVLIGSNATALLAWWPSQKIGQLHCWMYVQCTHPTLRILLLLVSFGHRDQEPFDCSWLATRVRPAYEPVPQRKGGQARMQGGVSKAKRSLQPLESVEIHSCMRYQSSHIGMCPRTAAFATPPKL